MARTPRVALIGFALLCAAVIVLYQERTSSERTLAHRRSGIEFQAGGHTHSSNAGAHYHNPACDARLVYAFPRQHAAAKPQQTPDHSPSFAPTRTTTLPAWVGQAWRAGTGCSALPADGRRAPPQATHGLQDSFPGCRWKRRLLHLRHGSGFDSVLTIEASSANAQAIREGACANGAAAAHVHIAHVAVGRVARGQCALVSGAENKNDYEVNCENAIASLPIGTGVANGAVVRDHVRMTTIDDVVTRDAKWQESIYVEKIDVAGFELEAAQGARRFYGASVSRS